MWPSSIFDPGTCRVDAVSLAGSAIGAPRARRKHNVRCDGDLRQVLLMSEDASASDLESEDVEATLCACCAHNYEQRATNVGCSVCGMRMAAAPAVTPPTPRKAAAGWPNCFFPLGSARAARAAGFGPLSARGPALGAQPGEGREGDYEFGGARALHNHGHRRVRARDGHE